MKKYPNGLDVSIQSWAKNTLRACENQYVNRMDCATAFALCRLAGGDTFDFVAFRYRADDKEALAIVTESMQIEGISLGMCSYIKYKDVETLCQTLITSAAKHIDIELIALRTGLNARVYLEAVGVANSLRWSKNPSQTIADHRKWKADRMMQEWSYKLCRDYQDTNKVPSKKDLLAFADEWAQYNDDSKAVDTFKAVLESLNTKQIKKMLADGPTWGVYASLLMYRDMI